MRTVSSAAALMGGALGLLAGAIVGAIIVIAGDDEPADGWRSIIALVAAAPHALAIAAAYASRPAARMVLLLVASTAGLLLSFALYTVGPLFWPAVVLELIATVRAFRKSGSSGLGDLMRPLSSLGAAFLFVIAFFALFLHDDPRCARSSCTSDVVTASEAMLALVLTGAGLALAVWIARDESRRVALR
ncbi:MAG TPA: hypothetical protein VNL92_03060 [Dehalococcoidia bacterium]|nr:hypothetical protein [Dehalococcoidia bacterium]